MLAFQTCNEVKHDYNGAGCCGPDQSNTIVQKTYDAIVVGSGPAGTIITTSFVQEGKRVLLLESGSNSAGYQSAFQCPPAVFENPADVPTSQSMAYANQMSNIRKAIKFDAGIGATFGTDLIPNHLGGGLCVNVGYQNTMAPEEMLKYQTYSKLTLDELKAGRAFVRRFDVLGHTFDDSVTPRMTSTFEAFDEIAKSAFGFACNNATDETQLSMNGPGCRRGYMHHRHDTVSNRDVRPVLTGLMNAESSGRLDIVLSAQVTEVIHSGMVATGVRYTNSEDNQVVVKARNVILSASTVGNPIIMKRSGFLNHTTSVRYGSTNMQVIAAFLSPAQKPNPKGSYSQFGNNLYTQYMNLQFPTASESADDLFQLFPSSVANKLVDLLPAPLDGSRVGYTPPAVMGAIMQAVMTAKSLSNGWGGRFIGLVGENRHAAMGSMDLVDKFEDVKVHPNWFDDNTVASSIIMDYELFRFVVNDPNNTLFGELSVEMYGSQQNFEESMNDQITFATTAFATSSAFQLLYGVARAFGAIGMGGGTFDCASSSINCLRASKKIPSVGGKAKSFTFATSFLIDVHEACHDRVKELFDDPSNSLAYIGTASNENSYQEALVMALDVKGNLSQTSEIVFTPNVQTNALGFASGKGNAAHICPTLTMLYNDANWHTSGSMVDFVNYDTYGVKTDDDQAVNCLFANDASTHNMTWQINPAYQIAAIAAAASKRILNNLC